MTRAEIDAARTPAGGWTKEQLAQWNVPWPPPKGWKAKLIASGAVNNCFINISSMGRDGL